MAWESPRVQKALADSAARQRVRQAAAEAGPYLSIDGLMIMVPSPSYHAELAKTLEAAGFRFSDGEKPVWRRATAVRHLGRVWPPASWLDWARRHYSKAWEWEGEGSSES